MFTKNGFVVMWRWPGPAARRCPLSVLAIKLEKPQARLSVQSVRRLFERQLRLVDFVGLVDGRSKFVVVVCPDTGGEGAERASQRLRQPLADAGAGSLAIGKATFPDDGFFL